MLTLVESNLHGFPISRHGFVSYNRLDSGKFMEEDALIPGPFHVVSCLAGCGLKLRRVVVLSALLGGYFNVS